MSYRSLTFRGSSCRAMVRGTLENTKRDGTQIFRQTTQENRSRREIRKFLFLLKTLGLRGYGWFLKPFCYWSLRSCGGCLHLLIQIYSPSISICFMTQRPNLKCVICFLGPRLIEEQNRWRWISRGRMWKNFSLSTWRLGSTGKEMHVSMGCKQKIYHFQK